MTTDRTKPTSDGIGWELAMAMEGCPLPGALNQVPAFGSGPMSA